MLAAANKNENEPKNEKRKRKLKPKNEKRKTKTKNENEKRKTKNEKRNEKRKNETTKNENRKTKKKTKNETFVFRFFVFRVFSFFVFRFFEFKGTCLTEIETQTKRTAMYYGKQMFAVAFGEETRHCFSHLSLSGCKLPKEKMRKTMPDYLSKRNKHQAK